MSKRILLVEDEPTIRTAVRDALRSQGCEVDATADGADALQRAGQARYDLIVLDVMLPGRSGFEVCMQLRQRGDRTPILMLTARGTEDDRVRGLALGADDYVTKPFSVRELLARVQACLRRGDWSGGSTRLRYLRGEGLEIDLDRSEGTADGVTHELTPKEVGILRYLAEHRDRVVTRPEFLTSVWGYPSGTMVETRTVENTIGKLRKKIERDRKAPRVVLTVHGAGWKLGEGIEACDG
ncbi:MAG: response regulator transcription factor [Planctomycetota bacterium]